MFIPHDHHRGLPFVLFSYGTVPGIAGVQKYLSHDLVIICETGGENLTVTEDEASQAQITSEEVQADGDDLDPSPW